MPSTLSDDSSRPRLLQPPVGRAEARTRTVRPSSPTRKQVLYSTALALLCLIGLTTSAPMRTPQLRVTARAHDSQAQLDAAQRPFQDPPRFAVATSPLSLRTPSATAPRGLMAAVWPLFLISPRVVETGQSPAADAEIAKLPWGKALAHNQQVRLQRSLEQVLLKLRPDSLVARRTAAAAIEMSQLPVATRYGITPEIIVGLIRIENPMLRPRVRSEAGAVGLMQVMPIHRGMAGCPRGPLDDVRTNLCHGVKVLGDALRRYRGDWHRALLAYNGCVTGSRTPNCHSYPMVVARSTAKVRARVEARFWLDEPRGMAPLE